MSFIWWDEGQKEVKKRNLKQGTYRIGRVNYEGSNLHLLCLTEDDHYLYMKRIDAFPSLVSLLKGKEGGSVRIDYDEKNEKLRLYRCKSLFPVKAFVVNYIPENLSDEVLADENIFLKGNPVELPLEGDGDGLVLSPGQAAALYLYSYIYTKTDKNPKPLRILKHFLGTVALPPKNEPSA